MPTKKQSKTFTFKSGTLPPDLFLPIVEFIEKNLRFREDWENGRKVKRLVYVGKVSISIDAQD